MRKKLSIRERLVSACEMMIVFIGLPIVWIIALVTKTDPFDFDMDRR